MKKWALSIILMLLLTSVISGAMPSDNMVYVIEIEGMITAGTALHVENGIEDAVDMGASAVVIQIDTPGGLVDATIDIVRTIDNSPIPVITYVPRGGIAASAGAYILLAGHVAAMSPGTTTGSSMPIMADPAGAPGPADNKTISYMSAVMRGIAEERGRPVDVAERFVTDNLALTASEALERGVIDVIAGDVHGLLEEVDGMTVMVMGAKTHLQTADAEISVREEDIRSQIINLLSNPQVVFILLLVGTYGIIFGFSSPGTYVPEMIGAICLILALYGLGTFDVDVFGIILIIAAVILFVAGVLTPTYGILMMGGVVCLILGAFMLPQEPLLSEEWFRTFQLIVLGMAGTSVAFFIFGVGAVMKTRRKKPTTGIDELIEKTARAVTDIDPEGKVTVRGEIWNARAENGTIKQGDTVKIICVDGLTLLVRKIEKEHDKWNY